MREEGRKARKRVKGCCARGKEINCSHLNLVSAARVHVCKTHTSEHVDNLSTEEAGGKEPLEKEGDRERERESVRQGVR